MGTDRRHVYINFFHNKMTNDFLAKSYKIATAESLES